MSFSEELLSVLCLVGVPDIESWRSEDLDWLFKDDSAAEWLRWLCARLGAHDCTDASSLVLSDAELKEWTAMSPEDVLEGDALTQALEAYDNTDESEESLRASLSALSEELDLESMALEQLRRASTVLTSPSRLRRGRTGEGRLYRAELELQKRREQADREGDRLDAVLSKTTEDIAGIARALHDSEINLLTKCDVSRLLHKDVAVLEATEALFKAQFGHDSNGHDRTMVLLEDETVDESAIEQELSRLSRAIRVSAEDELLAKAASASAVAAEETLDRYIQHYKQSLADTGVPRVESSFPALEQRITLLQTDLNQLKSTRIQDFVEQCVAVEMDTVTVLELQKNLHLEAFRLDRLNHFIAHYVMKNKARLSVLVSLAYNESLALNKTLLKLVELHVLCQSHHEQVCTERTYMERVDRFERERKRGIQHNDAWAHCALQLLDCKRPVVHTRFDPDCLTGLSTEFCRKRKILEDKEAELESLQAELERLLPRMKSRMHLNDTVHYDMASPAVSLRIQELQRLVRSFEIGVMQASSAWEKEKKQPQKSRYAQEQKRLWVDFMRNPKKMEATVEAMVQKATKF